MLAQCDIITRPELLPEFFFSFISWNISDWPTISFKKQVNQFLYVDFAAVKMILPPFTRNLS